MEATFSNFALWLGSTTKFQKAVRAVLPSILVFVLHLGIHNRLDVRHVEL